MGGHGAELELNMADNLTKLGPADPARVDASNAAELRWWCRRFDCTREELIETVAAVGDDAAAVQRALVTRAERRPKALSRVRRSSGRNSRQG